MFDSWLWLLAGAGVIFWLASLVAVRFWTRRQVLRSLAAVPDQEDDLILPFPDLRPEDRQALELVRTYRRRFLLQVWPETTFTLRSLLNLSMDLVQQIAAVYHPGEERPELHASLAGLINLHTRISVRLQELLTTLPLRVLKDLKLQTILYCHDLYQLCVSHPAYRFLRRHRLDKVVQWAWMLKNIASPWYWGRRAAFSGGKEILARFFLARYTAIVGLEAIRLYSGRAPGNELGRTYDLAWQEIRHLAADDPSLEAAALKFFLRLVLRSRELPETTKLSLLKRLTEKVAEPAVVPGAVSASERRQVERWLRQFIHSAFPASARAARLADMQRRLAEIPAEVQTVPAQRSQRR